MTALATPTELERLARERDEFVAWLAHQFPDALSIEDVEDLVAEALPSLAGDPQLPGRGRRRRNYIRRALWRDALDELRHRHGRDLQDGARELVPLAEASAVIDPTLAPETALEAAQAREQRRAAVERTLRRLRVDDAEVLRLKYLEGRAPEEIAAELGISRTQYERRLARAGERGRDALASAQSGPACGRVRQLLHAGPRFTRHDAARIDVHLLDCLHCRAYARVRGLPEVIGLPVMGVWERLASRLGALVGRGGGSAVRDAQDAALASGTAVGAGTAVTVGLGTKVAVGCAGVVLASVCAGPLVHEVAPKPTGASTPRTSERAHPARRAPSPASRTPQPTTTAIASARTAAPTPTATAARQASPRRVSASERRRRQRAAAAREIGPEAATPAVTSTAKATAASASSASSGANAPPPPPPPPNPSKAGTRSSSFSEEFRP